MGPKVILGRASWRDLACESSLAAGIEFVRASRKACRVLLHPGQHVELPDAGISSGSGSSAQSFAQALGRTKYWAAPIDLVLLPDPVFITKSSLIITRDQRIYDELTYDIYSAKLWEDLIVADGHLHLSDWYSERIKDPKIIKGLSIIVHPRWHKIYMHWLCEALAALCDPASQIDSFSNICVPNGPEFQMCSLEMATAIKSRLHVLDAPLYQFEIAAIPTHILARTWTHPAAIPGLVDFASRTTLEGGAPSGEAELIYLSREDASARKMVNEPELAEALTNLGFTKIIASDLNYRDQVRIFSRAKFMISPHGSGLTNLLFMGSGKQVLELRPMYAGSRGRLWDRSYHILAALTAKKYSVVVNENDPNIEDWACEISHLLPIVESILRAF